MNTAYQTRRDEWLSSPAVDPETKRTICEMPDGEAEAAFSGGMTFGTAGLRAVMTPGDARMNVYTVARATAGLALVIAAEGDDAKKAGVVIAHDSRNNSALFARRAAEVLSAYGIRVYLFSELRPTPVLSFAVRQLGCTAGINITASHNAKEYNGYKVYWRDGAQIGPEEASAISEKIDELSLFDSAFAPDKTNDALISSVPSAVDEAYREAVLAQRIDKELIPRAADRLTVVYTPLYGTGATMVPEVLRRAGLERLYTVDEQMTPDGNFPTTPYPNPENADVFTLGAAVAEKVHSDLLIATDPDADRCGTMVRDSAGKFRTLTGNQMGALLLDYIIGSYRRSGTMPPEPYAVKSFVTTELASRICRENGIEMIDVLTGFKYIGEAIGAHERAGHGSYIFGMEESYGYLKGTYARDKDAVVASLLICEMAAYYALNGMSLFDALEALYRKYGYYEETAFSVAIKGLGAAERMAAIMDRLRAAAPDAIGGEPVVRAMDYRAGTSLDRVSGKVSGTGLPTADALRYVTASDVQIIVRPSGTEPKIKIYLMAGGKTESEVHETIARCRRDMEALLDT